jgi:hypothetical protein
MVGRVSPGKSEQTLAPAPRRCSPQPGLANPRVALRPDPHRLVRARLVRARVRAQRRGSGVRTPRVAASTTWTAAWALVCQAAWTATGLAPARVRTQQPTTCPFTSSGALVLLWSTGQAPSATSGRVVTPTVGEPKHRPEPQRQPGAAGMVTAGGLDHQHLGDDLRGTDGPLEQGNFPEGEQGRQIGPAGGPADTHPRQQATAAGHRCAGEASVIGGTSPLDPLVADEAGAILSRVVGGCQRSGVISPRA